MATFGASQAKRHCTNFNSFNLSTIQEDAAPQGPQLVLTQEGRNLLILFQEFIKMDSLSGENTPSQDLLQRIQVLSLSQKVDAKEFPTAIGKGKELTTKNLKDAEALFHEAMSFKDKDTNQAISIAKTIAIPQVQSLALNQLFEEYLTANEIRKAVQVLEEFEPYDQCNRLLDIFMIYFKEKDFKLALVYMELATKISIDGIPKRNIKEKALIQNRIRVCSQHLAKQASDPSIRKVINELTKKLKDIPLAYKA